MVRNYIVTRTILDLCKAAQAGHDLLEARETVAATPEADKDGHKE